MNSVKNKDLTLKNVSRNKRGTVPIYVYVLESDHLSFGVIEDGKK